MSIVHVDAASRSYDVLVDELTLDDLGELCKRVSGGDTACVVSDTNVAPLYMARARASLEAAGYAVSEFVFEAGEPSKTLATYGACINALADAGLTRDSVVVALGGGVVGDLAGFAAATYMRGCHCVQVPTSLLSCVDSSVGGKTAVDLPAGKNLVGAFFQPDAVLVDTALLDTLPDHFFTDGCAEVLKYGVIADADLFAELETPLVPRDQRLADIIARCVAIKRDVVQTDEREKGLRQILNFGHTLGHALEKNSNFQLTHGFGVACGMVLMARACAARGLCSQEDLERLAGTVAAYGLPVETDCTAEEVYAASLADKKRHGSTMNVVAMRGFGSVEVQKLPLEDYERLVSQALAAEGEC